MGFEIHKSDIQKLLQDKKLMNTIIKKVINNPKSMGKLAKDVTEKLVDVLEDSPEFKKKIREAALSHWDFKKRVVMRLGKNGD